MNNTTDDPSDPLNNPAFVIGLIFAMVTIGILLSILIVWLLEKRFGPGYTVKYKNGLPVGFNPGPADIQSSAASTTGSLTSVE